ncbi:fructoselysine 3-epimerase [Planctomycetes bacterium Poly30]|uniref:Fructoselysine 3-epimerase n=1 Tax=Saltatorellus ferox TaxID=2528018 RepID=A0A518F0J4_9BACT|nr:fructoselysine 3-epimerase [Planctomycetes bacterium Poly30]
MFRLGYNTNGLPFQRLGDALELVSDLGYEAVAITPDVGALDPLRLSPADVAEARKRLDDLGLSVAIETGARFVLDPRRKHRPTLLEASAAERERRVDFYFRCLALAVELGADVVSLWAGAAPEGEPGTLDELPEHPLLDRLASGLAAVLERARDLGVRVGFEPEPGMFIERPAGFRTLLGYMGPAGDDLGLTLDVGHCVVTGDLPVSSVVDEFAGRLLHVHLADCPRGRHHHVPFGEGDLDLVDALRGLTASGFQGMAAVELSRDGHRGPEAAADALASLHAALTEI